METKMQLSRLTNVLPQRKSGLWLRSGSSSMILAKEIQVLCQEEKKAQGEQDTLSQSISSTHWGRWGQTIIWAKTFKILFPYKVLKFFLILKIKHEKSYHYFSGGSGTAADHMHSKLSSLLDKGALVGRVIKPMSGEDKDRQYVEERRGKGICA